MSFLCLIICAEFDKEKRLDWIGLFKASLHEIDLIIENICYTSQTNIPMAQMLPVHFNEITWHNAVTLKVKLQYGSLHTNKSVSHTSILVLLIWFDPWTPVLFNWGPKKYSDDPGIWDATIFDDSRSRKELHIPRKIQDRSISVIILRCSLAILKHSIL